MIMNFRVLRFTLYFDIGITYAPIGIYEGEHKDNQLHGKGVLKYNNGDSYEGEFANNFFEGTGTYS